MRNSSQKAGCMRRWLRSPAGASHCCHERVLVCTTAAAAAWVSPAASRAARTCSGVGFAEGPFGPRFGWLVILILQSTSFSSDFITQHISRRVGNLFNDIGIDQNFRCFRKRYFVTVVGHGATELADNMHHFGHFLLQPLTPRRGGLQCASHELKYTRIARKSKHFFEVFSRGQGSAICAWRALSLASSISRCNVAL